MSRCPFLVDLAADWLAVHPLGVFCRCPGGRIRFPAAATLATRCSGNRFRDCQHYAS
jgi:hypothetical protein